MLLEIKQRKGSNDLTFSYVNSKGEIVYDVCPVIDRTRRVDDNFNWVKCTKNHPDRDPDHINWNGEAVRRDTPSTLHLSPRAPVKFADLTQTRCMEIIQTRYSGEELAEIDCYRMPKMTFVDIETGMSPDGFERPETARQPVTVIGMATEDHRIIVYGVNPLSGEQVRRIQNDIDEHTKSLNGVHFDFSYARFETEGDMLVAFFREMRNMGMISGWNVVGFDWAYLYNRAKRMNIRAAQMASPVGMSSGRENFPTHVPIVDYMECYKRWDKSVEQKENYKLDQAGYDVLGVQKVHFTGSLQDLYEQDFPKYVYYNAIDCILVEQLHERLKLTDIGCTLAWIAKTPVNKMQSVVATTEGALADAYRRAGRVICDSGLKKPDGDGEGYEGAFVKDPVVGLHLYVSCNDFASLYPNIMRELNMSPETLLHKVDENDTAAKEKWRKKGYIVSQSGCVFEPNTTPGVFATLIGDIYNQRKAFKKKSYVCADRQRKLEVLAKRMDLSDEEALAEMERILAA